MIELILFFLLALLLESHQGALLGHIQRSLGLNLLEKGDTCCVIFDVEVFVLHSACAIELAIVLADEVAVEF